MQQFNRFYELTVGDYRTREGIVIRDLQLSFDISKSADNKKESNSASIEVVNLSAQHLKLLETSYPLATLKVGFQSRDNIRTLFSGEVGEVVTRKSGTDRTTQLILGSSYTELNHETISKIVPAGSTVGQVVEELLKTFPNIKRGNIIGTNLNSVLINGYPMSGTLRKELNRLATNYNLNWQIDNNTLSVSDSTRATTENFGTAFLITPRTGLIETPYYVSGKKGRASDDPESVQGVQFSMLINPEVPIGGIIKLQDTAINGWFRTDTIRYSGAYRGGNWIQEVYCTSLEKITKKVD